MRMVKKWNAGCLFAVMVLLLFSAAALAAPSGNGAKTPAPVVDKAGIIAKDDVQRLSERIREVEAKHGVRIGICVQKSVKGSIGKAANQLLDESYSGGTNGGIVLLLAMDSRDWHISTDNAMRMRITDDEGIPYVGDQFLGQLKKKDYAGAFESYVNAVDTLLVYYEQQGKPYRPSDEFSFLALFLAVIASCIGGWLVRAGLISSMSNVTHAAEAGTYLERDSVNITENSDTFLFMNVTRTPKKKHKSGWNGSGRDSEHGGGGGKF